MERRLGVAVPPNDPVRRHVHRRQCTGRDPRDERRGYLDADEGLTAGGRPRRRRDRLVRVLAVARAHIEVAGLGVVRRRAPVVSSGCTGRDGGEAPLVERREDAAEAERPAVRCDLREGIPIGALPCERVSGRYRLRRRGVLEGALRHRLLADLDDRSSGSTVELVHPAGLARLGNDVANVAADRAREQDGVRGAVVVPDVVMDDLVVPRVRTGRRVQSNERGCIEVVARPAVRPGVGVAGREVKESGLRVDARRAPDGAAARLPLVVRRPRRPAGLAGLGDRVEAPDEVTVPRVERGDGSAHAELAAGDADDHEAVVVERRHRHRVAVLRAAVRRRPDDAAGLLREGDERRIELRDVDLPVAERKPALRPAAADGAQRLRELRAVLPQDRPGGSVDREDVAGAGDGVHDAAVDERRALAPVLRSRARSVQMDVPARCEPANVARGDLLQ